jgi:maleate cis-trans isomerase
MNGGVGPDMKKIPTIGFISAPAWFDPAPSEFPEVVKEAVRTQQAPLLITEFDYRLESIASLQNELNLCARSLKAMGCDLVAQVGSPFAWACAESEPEARKRNESMTEATNIPCVMMGLAIVDGLRSLGVNKVAVNCTYYDTDWRDGFAAFLRICGFDTRHVSSLSDQGLTESNAKMEDYGWSMTDELAMRSVCAVADASPEAEAMVVTGAGTRTLGILSDLESKIGSPIIAADTILYWAIARELNLTLKPVMGSLSKLQKIS